MSATQHPKTLEYWFDFASTYSYLTSMRIVSVCQKRGIPLVWRPFLLGPLFKEQGWNTSPFNIYPEDSQHWLSKAESDEVKNALRERTDRARSLGIFGAPSFIVNGELFWGDDRLKEACKWAISP